MPAPYRGVLLDLFGTVVHFAPTNLPELQVGGRRVRTTLASLGPLVAEWLPSVDPGALWAALASVSEEMARVRAVDHVEWPSRERFRRALERLGCGGEARAEIAALLSRAHMRVIASVTTVPVDHVALLRALHSRYRLALVSNFDDTGTAYDILQRHQLIEHFDTIVVSEAVGLRKPHPALVRTALRELRVEARDALFVGDSLPEDIAGACAAGVDAVWIDSAGQGPPTAGPIARHVIRRLPEVAEILGRDSAGD